MDYCFCNITAFKLLQHTEKIPRVAYADDPAAALARCGMSKLDRPRTFLGPFGFDDDETLHLLTGKASLSYDAEGVVRHFLGSNAPAKAVLFIEPHIRCTSPEETYLSLAASISAEMQHELPCKAEARLALYGMELCGLYYREAKTEKLRQREAPLTNTRRIKQYLEQCSGRSGILLARKALAYVENRSRSPMESACALLLCRSRRLGSAGFPLGEINCLLQTSAGKREVDRFWKKYRLAYEYQGREYHTEETRQQEDRRRNELLGSGITVINIWYEDLARSKDFQNLIKILAKSMGLRMRIRDPEFKERQKALRSVVLPTLDRYG